MPVTSVQTWLRLLCSVVYLYHTLIPTSFSTFFFLNQLSLVYLWILFHGTKHYYGSIMKKQKQQGLNNKHLAKLQDTAS